MLERIISHMNDHHKDELIGLVKKFGNVKDPQEITLQGVDTKGLDILCDGKVVRVDFAKEVQESELKNAIIELCASVPKTTQYDEIKKEMLEFRDSFGSVVIASVDSCQKAIASYAPLLRYENRFFIYISEVAEHYDSIKSNPSALEVLFLEDEKEAVSVILRKRLRYKAKAEFREKDEFFEKVFEAFEIANPKAGGLKAIKKWNDFHFIELVLGEGRFVKGFGAAYDVDSEGNVKFVGESKNPHQLPHQ